MYTKKIKATNIQDNDRPAKLWKWKWVRFEEYCEKAHDSKITSQIQGVRLLINVLHLCIENEWDLSEMNESHA